MPDTPKPIFFATAQEFREWLEENHQTAKEVFVGYYKVGTGKPSMTWSESVDQALCFGWIDGVRRSLDENSYTNRFTTRKPKSNWSSINIEKVRVLMEKGLMHPAGMAAFNKREEARSGVYAYENRPKTLGPKYEKIFKQNKTAWEFFSSQAPSYQRTIIYWIMNAKQEITRMSRLEKTINASAEKRRL